MALKSISQNRTFQNYNEVDKIKEIQINNAAGNNSKNNQLLTSIVIY
jgi:hypothetical protein